MQIELFSLLFQKLRADSAQSEALPVVEDDDLHIRAALKTSKLERRRFTLNV